MALDAQFSSTITVRLSASLFRQLWWPKIFGISSPCYSATLGGLIFLTTLRHDNSAFCLDIRPPSMPHVRTSLSPNLFNATQEFYTRDRRATNSVSGPSLGISLTYAINLSLHEIYGDLRASGPSGLLACYKKQILCLNWIMVTRSLSLACFINI